MSGPKCKIWPFFIVPLMTVPANTTFFYTLNLFEIKNSECKSWLFLSQPVDVNKLKKFIKRSKLCPVTLEIKNIGITSSVEVIREYKTAFYISLITLAAF